METAVAQRGIDAIDDILNIVVADAARKARAIKPISIPSAEKLVRDSITNRFDDKAARSITRWGKRLRNVVDTGGDAAIDIELRRIDERITRRSLSTTESAAMRSAVLRSYVGGQQEKAAALNIVPSFNLVDTRAQGFIADNNLYWVRDRHDVDVRTAIEAATRETFEQGLGRAEAAALIEDSVGEFIEEEATLGYWNIIASTAVNTSRNMGRISSFEMAEIFSVEFFNPDDEKTSPICKYMNGTVWELKLITGQRDKYIAAQTPEEVKAAVPWMTVNEARKIGGGTTDPKDPAALARAGVAIPPLHGECRSSLTVAQIAAIESAIKQMLNADAVNQAPPVDSAAVHKYIQGLFYDDPAALYMMGVTSAKNLITVGAVADEALVKKISRGTTTLPVLVQVSAEGAFEILQGGDMAASAIKAGHKKLNVIIKTEFPLVPPSNASQIKQWQHFRNLRFSWERQYSMYTRVNGGGIRSWNTWQRITDDTLPEAEVAPLRVVRPAYESVYANEMTALIAAWGSLGKTRRTNIARDLLNGLFRKLHRKALTKEAAYETMAQLTGEAIHKLAYARIVMAADDVIEDAPSAEVSTTGARTLLMRGREINTNELQQAADAVLNTLADRLPA